MVIEIIVRDDENRIIAQRYPESLEEAHAELRKLRDQMENVFGKKELLDVTEER